MLQWLAKMFRKPQPPQTPQTPQPQSTHSDDRDDRDMVYTVEDMSEVVEAFLADKKNLQMQLNGFIQFCVALSCSNNYELRVPKEFFDLAADPNFQVNLEVTKDDVFLTTEYIDDEHCEHGESESVA